jgi:hypothetical protein
MEIHNLINKMSVGKVLNIVRRTKMEIHFHSAKKNCGKENLNYMLMKTFRHLMMMMNYFLNLQN